MHFVTYLLFNQLLFITIITNYIHEIHETNISKHRDNNINTNIYSNDSKHYIYIINQSQRK